MVGAIGGIGISGGLGNLGGLGSIGAVGGLASASAVGASANIGTDAQTSAIPGAPLPSMTVTISEAAKKALAVDLNLSPGVMGSSSKVAVNFEINNPDINALGQSVSGLNQMDKMIEALFQAILLELQKKDNAPTVVA